MRLKRVVRRVALLLLVGLAGFLLLSVGAVGVLRWVDPPTSSVMIQHRVSAWIEGRERPYLHHEWTPLEAIAGPVPLAVVAAEDQRFPSHRGFDLVEIEKAWRDYRDGGRMRGASTLSQQVAKNLFLWQGKSLIRKGLEVWFTLLIESLWPKQRILEVYLNIAQLGPNTYGVSAASWRYFDRPPAALGPQEAALIAAVLPNPKRYRLDAPSSYVRQRAAWVRTQMRQLGPDYLKKL
ncbi:MAG: monofunctional biosynthetic peptidoglycan transglycosylase [Chromatiaceae bacterium]|jgi:monofunctional biosynthetic peptidoglycan transglycosylase|nr:monofunctional biosynthetic peptidoglycan transglycosylase [Chromatiaceae bacterium]